MRKQRVGLAIAAIAFGTATLAWSSVRAASDPSFELAQMIANQSGFGKATVAVGKLPAGGAEGVPLPEGARLVGSVVGAPLPAVLRRFAGAHETTLYYEVPNTGVVDAYSKTLVAAGWKAAPLFAPRLGGFVDSTTPGRERSFCGSGNRRVGLRTPTGSPDELVVSISTPTAASDTLSPCTKDAMADVMHLTDQFRAPLPELQAPAGTELNAATPFAGPFQSSTAYLKTSLSPDAVLAAFASQFTASGWTAERKATGAGIATESFTHHKGGKIDWQAAMTIDRAGVLDYAYITATPENGE